MENLLVLGDIHGDINKLISNINKYDISDISILQVGDFGIGFESIFREAKRMKYLDQFLQKRNVVLYVIRGNHDDPKFFRNTWRTELYNFNISVRKFTSKKVNAALDIFENLENIIFLEDYSVLTISGKRILCVGGAISIDRFCRKEDSSWWKDEHVTLDIDKLNTIEPVDYLCLHMAPPSVYNQIKYNLLDSSVAMYALKDETLKADLAKESEVSEQIFQHVMSKGNIERFFCGHYHKSINAIINDIRVNILGCDELLQII